jgi:hypothetical protein
MMIARIASLPVRLFGSSLRRALRACKASNYGRAREPAHNQALRPDADGITLDEVERIVI